MQTLLRTCVLLIAVLVAVHIIGCGENVMQEVELDLEDTSVIDETEAPVDSVPIQADGEPVPVTDATFNSVVLDAELPVVLELGAEW